MSDDRPSPEEQAEAEALAKALVEDPSAGSGPAPSDALEAASLLGLDSAELTPERQAAVWDRIQAGLPEKSTARRPVWRRWLLPVGSLAAAAAAALALVVVLPGAPAPTRLPRPDADLLRAQAQAASGEPAAAVRLRADMRTYRGDLYARLQDRYGGRP